MKLECFSIKDFTVFDEREFGFHDGVNLFFGAKETGKSHVLKILYSLVQSIPGRETPIAKEIVDPTHLYGKPGIPPGSHLKGPLRDLAHFNWILNGVFKLEDGKIGWLIRDPSSDSTLHLIFDAGHHFAGLRHESGPEAYDDTF